MIPLRYLLPLAVLAAPAAAAPLDDVARHLAAVKTMTADFTQTAERGATLSGRLTLARPGRVRFQYEKAPLLIVADGRAVNLVDYEVAQVTSWPIRGTPLALLLDPTLDLKQFARVLPGTAASEIAIEGRDPRHPEYGVTTLRFARDSTSPGGLKLLGWSVLDAQGRTTRVALADIRFNIAVDQANFRFRDPRRRTGAGKG